MMNGKLCVSVTSADFAECQRAVRSSQMAELRLDLMQLQPAQVQALLRHGTPTIATCREGRYALHERLSLLRHAMEQGATFIDVEVEASEAYRCALVEQAKRSGCKVIISYHNFACTPSAADLVATIATCRSMGADVVKLITTARTPRDSARVLSLYDDEATQAVSLVAFAMGEAGKITRLACLYLGAPFTYASMCAGKEAAPGQLTAETMREVVRGLTTAI